MVRTLRRCDCGFETNSIVLFKHHTEYCMQKRSLTDVDGLSLSNECDSCPERESCPERDESDDYD